MALYHVDAIILHARDSGEADRIVTAYSLEEGRLVAIAKGTRRPHSRLAGGLHPFACSHLLLWRGKALDVVTQCQLRQSFPRLRTSLSAVAAATLVCELVTSFTQERDPCPALYALLRGTLAALDEGAGEGTVLAFALGVLALCGYAPRLDRCVHCGGKLIPGECVFDVEAGGMACARCRGARAGLPVSAAARQALLYLAGAPPAAAGRLQLGGATMGEVKALVLACLEARLERRPRSWTFWLEMATEGGSGRIG